MNKPIIRRYILFSLVLIPFLVLQSCDSLKKSKDGGGGGGGGSESPKKGGGLLKGGGLFGKSSQSATDDPLGGIKNGELVANARKGYKQTAPAGMVLIPSGSFTMGQADEDIMSTKANLNKRITISPFYMDDTEITNNEYRMFVNSMLADSVSVLGEEFIMSRLYPDTTVWKKDYTYHNGDQLTENYYSSPAFDSYPVVGVSWDAATYFCKWRSSLLNNYRSEGNLFRSPSFRLPSESEWEWAARGGKEGVKYPWGNPYVANGRGCYLANFKPYRGNYSKDGYSYTAPANAFEPNDYGLYNMAGNVSEWTQDAYSESYMPLTWDLNPTFDIADEPRKVIKGGSWKDVAYFLETGTTTFEYRTATRSYIGFRCALNRLGSVPGRE